MEPRLTLCPRCGSHEVHSDHLTPLGQRYKCPACGYEGSFVIEADSLEDAKRIRRQLQADLGEEDEQTSHRSEPAGGEDEGAER